MKKILAIILALVANATYAKEIVTVYWGWGAADSLANISRTLVHEANQIQDKYTFIFDIKSGAGGAIAADFVRRTPNTILATSSAFFVRPNLYPTTNNYKVSGFKALMPQCYSPISITSGKYHSWQEVPENAPLFVGNTGMGSTTHLTSIQLKQNYSNLTFVPFRGVAEAFTAMVAGDVDFDAGFLGSAENWKMGKNTKKITVLGITGTDRSFNYPLLIDQGFPSILGSITLPQHLVVSASTPPEKSDEWRKILIKASNAAAVRESYKTNYCTAMDDMASEHIQDWFDTQVLRWKKISYGINLETQ
jgi:tripartite-type tricarboxylate transporter receptor subunit TctC